MFVGFVSVSWEISSSMFLGRYLCQCFLGDIFVNVSWAICLSLFLGGYLSQCFLDSSLFLGRYLRQCFLGDIVMFSISILCYFDSHHSCFIYINCSAVAMVLDQERD